MNKILTVGLEVAIAIGLMTIVWGVVRLATAHDPNMPAESHLQLVWHGLAGVDGRLTNAYYLIDVEGANPDILVPSTVLTPMLRSRMTECGFILKEEADMVIAVDLIRQAEVQP